MKLAVVILNYNDAKGTADAVKRAATFSCFSHIVAVDNASSDNSAAVLRAAIENMHDERLHFIANERNGGYGYGNNAGVRYAHDELGAELVVIANPDAVFGEALINNMQRMLCDDLAAAAVGAVMRTHRHGYEKAYKGDHRHNKALHTDTDSNYGESENIEKHAGRKYIDITHRTMTDSAVTYRAEITQTRVSHGAQEAFTYEEYIASGWMRRNALQYMLNSGPISRRICRAYINYPAETYADSSRDAVSVYAVHGSLLMVAAEKFLSVGGYDEEMFLYGEENVLAEKLYRAGYKTYLLKQGYEHAGSVSITGAGLKAVQRQQLRNVSENYYYRHYLDCDESAMNIIRLFQRLVLAETRIAAGLHLI